MKEEDHIPEIAVLIACHNRRETTLRCLRGLFDQSCVPDKASLHVYLVDDGSSDGTGATVAQSFPEVHIIYGDGQLYWCGGMRAALEAARQAGSFDFVWWLNDDCFLAGDALARLLAAYEQLRDLHQAEPIIVGTTKDPQSGEATYGGLHSPWWHPFRYARVRPSDVSQPCTTFNGNCVLIPAPVERVVAGLDGRFRHILGDIDYGLRAASKGCAAWVVPGFVGECRRGEMKRLTLRSLKRDPKELPPREWLAFTRRHGGMLWWVFFVSPYFKLLLGALMSQLSGKTSQECLPKGR